ncbi:MAG: hypothetical protein NTZ65_04370 [Candidatus Berkelbacteria bacterium]|nr:hypothetical protein [Candidatus Berkelbacteria bacterium]
MRHKKKIKIYTLLLGLVLGVVVGLVAVKLFLPQNKIAVYVERYKKAKAFYRIAGKLPPSSIQSVRARAQASAILHGQNDYHFETGFNPAAGK